MDVGWVCAPGRPFAHFVDEDMCAGTPQTWAARCGWKFGQATLNFMTDGRRGDLGLTPCKKCERGRGKPVESREKGNLYSLKPETARRGPRSNHHLQNNRKFDTFLYVAG